MLHRNIFCCIAAFRVKNKYHSKSKAYKEKIQIEKITLGQKLD